MSTLQLAVPERQTPRSVRQVVSADRSSMDRESYSIENGQRALLNILEDFAAERSSLECGQRAMLNILDDFDAEKARMEGTQRAVLNILEDSVGEKTHLEAAQRSMLNILDDFSEEKTRLEQTQRAVLNILDDFETEKNNCISQRKIRVLRIGRRVLVPMHSIEAVLKRGVLESPRNGRAAPPDEPSGHI